jgi:predicted DNA-binding protein with PD1-like motif
MLSVRIKPWRCFMGRLAKGDDLLQALENFCRQQDIQVGEVRALGAVTKARVGYYHQEERKYYFLDLDQPLEILALVGNISIKDGKPMVHAHVTLGDTEGRAYGGHLAEGTPGFA